jgi:tetratricopeptide (TPR) repeat protein
LLPAYRKEVSSRAWLITTSIALLAFFEPKAGAQQKNLPTMSDQTPVATTSTGESGIIRLTVRGENQSGLDRQSVIRLYSHSKNAATWLTTTEKSDAAIVGLGLGQYDVQVSAVGYLTTEKTVEIVYSQQNIELDIVLHPDPSALDLNAPFDDLPQKARKEAKRSVVALKSGNLKDAQKHLDKAYAASPSSSETNFLFGYLNFQRGAFDRAEAYLQTASTSDPHNIQALILLGRVQFRRSDSRSAQKSLEQALAANPGSWPARDLLAEVYLKEKEYEKALKEAQFALDNGKGERSRSLLILCRALANLGRDQEGIRRLQVFLEATPESPAAPQVRALASELEKRAAAHSQHADMVQLPVSSPASEDLALDDSQPSLPDDLWQPAGIDEAKPAVATDLACPYDQVIELSGERVKQLVDDVARFAAIEDLVHEQLDATGNALSKETRKFDYVAAISNVQAGFLEVHEYRGQRYGTADLPEGIATQGFVALALVFHPEMRANFQMTCEGLGQWRGQATWLVHFRQRDDRPSRIESYKVEGKCTRSGSRAGRGLQPTTFKL